MPETISKAQRWLDLIAYLVGRRLPVSVEELMENVPAYAERWRTGEPTARASVRRTFERDKEELRANAAMPAPPEALSRAQSSVWSAIEEQQAKLGERSATGALDEMYTRRTTELEDAAKHFPHRQRQVGLLGFVGERPLAMDVIGGRQLPRPRGRRGRRRAGGG